MNFDEWINFIFDHSVTEPAWYWDASDEWDGHDLSEAQTVEYLTELFERAGTLLEPFSDAQPNQGLMMLVSGSYSDCMHSLRDQEVPLPDRLRGIQAMESLFEQCFALRCSPFLSHLDEPGVNPLNAVCYMWWDVIPIHGLAYHCPELADSVALDQACLAVMQKILKMDSVACQESALHGLGHWKSYYADPTNFITDFLKRHRKIRAELKEYALRAREGYVI